MNDPLLVPGVARGIKKYFEIVFITKFSKCFFLSSKYVNIETDEPIFFLIII